MFNSLKTWLDDQLEEPTTQNRLTVLGWLLWDVVGFVAILVLVYLAVQVIGYGSDWSVLR